MAQTPQWPGIQNLSKTNHTQVHMPQPITEKYTRYSSELMPQPITDKHTAVPTPASAVS